VRASLVNIVAVMLTVVSIIGCSMSTEQIEETVKNSMQQKFNSDTQFKEWHLSVGHVQVLKESSNKFKGIATVAHEGTQHDVPVDITVDGSNVIWQVQPGGFMFIAQKELQKLQTGFPLR
jgi:uncharacterized secreted protein with C-terminal beta-propeller domain